MGPVQFSPDIFLPEHFFSSFLLRLHPVETSIYQGFNRLLSRIYRPLRQTAAPAFSAPLARFLFHFAVLANRFLHGIVMHRTACNS